MIELTRLNGISLVVNSDLIQYAESAPDTTLTLVNGEKIIVCESTTEVIDLTVAYRARLMREAAKNCPGGMVLASGAAFEPWLQIQHTGLQTRSNRIQLWPRAGAEWKARDCGCVADA